MQCNEIGLTTRESIQEAISKRDRLEANLRFANNADDEAIMMQEIQLANWYIDMEYKKAKAGEANG